MNMTDLMSENLNNGKGVNPAELMRQRVEENLKNDVSGEDINAIAKKMVK